MSEQQKAYLVVRRMSFYTDEFFDDLTLQVGAVNPAGLYSTLAEAQAAVHDQTRETMRGATYYDLELGERGTHLLYNLAESPQARSPGARSPATSPLDPALRPLLACFHDGHTAIPHDLTDVQLDQLMALLDVQLFHILEADAPEFGVRLAQSLLSLTPDRPNIALDFDYVENDELLGEVIQESEDPVVERLNRVTALLGKRYANGITI